MYHFYDTMSRIFFKKLKKVLTRPLTGVLTRVRPVVVARKNPLSESRFSGFEDLSGLPSKSRSVLVVGGVLGFWGILVRTVYRLAELVVEIG
jgi:hypothetical protein